jgi:uncharacterized protein with FMN-binding domain
MKTVANSVSKGPARKRAGLALAALAAVSLAGPLPRAGADEAPAAPAPAPAASALKDGTFAGPRVNTFYGFVQVDAVIAGGVLKEVKVKEFPNNDGTSRRINAVAVPYLSKAAVTKGGADVDTVSGATLTTKAFAKSLDGALGAAR